MANLRQDKQAAFLNLVLGGTGLEAGHHIHELYEADRRPFSMAIVHVDTDPQSRPFVDHAVLIPLNGQKVNTMKADPDTFGSTVATIVRNYPQYLNPEDVRNGARTIRLLTQLSFEYHREQILLQLRKAILGLRHQGEFDHIIPVLISSSGGGTGSALQVLLPLALLDPQFRSRLTEGLPPGMLHSPILFVVEPFGIALQNQNLHADRILANAYAFRAESALIEDRHAFKYCIHLGLANDHGAVLDSPQEIAKVLGTSVYQWQLHWPLIKARFVDTVDSQAYASYTGSDIPELVLRRAHAAVPSNNGNQNPNLPDLSGGG